MIKYNTVDSIVTETLVTGLIKCNTDESLVTETLVTGLIKYILLYYNIYFIYT
jgi:hypothetical protein